MRRAAAGLAVAACAAVVLTGDRTAAQAPEPDDPSRLSDGATRQLVAEAEAAGDAVILVEIDPREGSGVIPLSWEAFLQPRDATDDRAAAGRNVPELRAVRALAGTRRRDYDYDIFWMVFPLTLADGTALFPAGVEEAELVVRIHDKEGRVRWRVPDSVRR